MAVPVTVFHQPPGGQATEIARPLSGLQLTTAIPGGFGSATFTCQGDFRRRLGYLGMLRFYVHGSLVWEGQLEDKDFAYDEQTRTTTVRAFGLARRFDETSVRKIWSKRDLDWNAPPVGGGGALGLGITNTTTGYLSSTGNYDPTDLTKSGIRFAGQGVSVAASAGAALDLVAPLGLTLTRLKGTCAYSGTAGSGTKLELLVASSPDGSTWTNHGALSAGAVDIALVASAARIRIFGWNHTAGALTPAATDLADLFDIRVLGTSLNEDATDGFYGGTILRDLVAATTDLQIGIVDDGTDFLIQAVERSTREAMRSVVDEVVGYYAREWAVWEDGKFYWQAKNLDEVQWIVMGKEAAKVELDASLDDIAANVYVLYTDAATGLTAEASAAASDQRNPYLRQSKTKDFLVSPGFPMTSNTAAQLAATVAADVGARPSVGGSCTIPASRQLGNAVAGGRPAALIRAGDNVAFPELPKTDVMLTGRDGETLFHIASTELDVDNDMMTLTLEGQQRRTDVILARLAAVTKTLTG